MDNPATEASSRPVVALVALALFLLAACAMCGLGGLLERIVMG